MIMRNTTRRKRQVLCLLLLFCFALPVISAWWTSLLSGIADAVTYVGLANDMIDTLQEKKDKVKKKIDKKNAEVKEVHLRYQLFKSGLDNARQLYTDAAAELMNIDSQISQLESDIETASTNKNMAFADVRFYIENYSDYETMEGYLSARTSFNSWRTTWSTLKRELKAKKKERKKVNGKCLEQLKRIERIEPFVNGERKLVDTLAAELVALEAEKKSIKGDIKAKKKERRDRAKEAKRLILAYQAEKAMRPDDPPPPDPYDFDSLISEYNEYINDRDSD